MGDGSRHPLELPFLHITKLAAVSYIFYILYEAASIILDVFDKIRDDLPASTSISIMMLIISLLNVLIIVLALIKPDDGRRLVVAFSQRFLGARFEVKDLVMDEYKTRMEAMERKKEELLVRKLSFKKSQALHSRREMPAGRIHQSNMKSPRWGSEFRWSR